MRSRAQGPSPATPSLVPQRSQGWFPLGPGADASRKRTGGLKTSCALDSCRRMVWGTSGALSPSPAEWLGSAITRRPAPECGRFLADGGVPGGSGLDLSTIQTHESLDPPIADSNGYCLRGSDLLFLGIGLESVDRWRMRVSPLGMEAADYQWFADSLLQALQADGIRDFDVRLKGSSAVFFSGLHKAMPWQRADMLSVFLMSWGREPEVFELERAASKAEATWPSSDTRPGQRIFDSLHNLGLERGRSDYDVQICSRDIAERSHAHLLKLGISEDAFRIDHGTYRFINKRFVERTCEHLAAWTARASEVLRRDVTVAVFPTSSTPLRSADSGYTPALDPDDWIIASNASELA